MNPQLTQMSVARLETVLVEFNRLVSKSKHSDLSDLSGHEQHKLMTMARAAVEAIAGARSPYAQQVDRMLTRSGVNDGDRVSDVAGVVDALLTDVKGGHLQSVAEVIHGELFGDFIEMAVHLLGDGFKDASAVIGGSSLEAHLRQLAQRFGVPVEAVSGGQSKPKKADLLNAELVKANAYSKLDQKNVTAWLDLRNNAAHGHYSAYTVDQVQLMLSAIQDFITRNPA